MSKRIRHGFFNKSSGVIFELRAELSCCGEARQGELFPVMLAIYFCFCFSYCCCCSCSAFVVLTVIVVAVVRAHTHTHKSRLYVTYMISSSSSRAKAPDMARRGEHIHSSHTLHTRTHSIIHIHIQYIVWPCCCTLAMTCCCTRSFSAHFCLVHFFSWRRHTRRMRNFLAAAAVRCVACCVYV